MIAPVATRSLDATEPVEAVSSASGGSAPSGLDAASFLALTGNSVRLLDGEIDDALRRAQKETADAQRSSTQIAALQAIQGALEQGKKKDDDSVAARDLRVTTEAGAVSARQLLDRAGLALPDPLSLRAVKTKVDELQSSRTAITQGQELRQLRLQELLGQRAHLLEQTSNLLRSLNDTLKSLIGNLR